MTVFRCPACAPKGRNHGFHLSVIAPVRCHVLQQFNSRRDADGNVIQYHLQTDPDLFHRNPPWDGTSAMKCGTCGHSGTAAEFQAEYDPSAPTTT